MKALSSEIKEKLAHASDRVALGPDKVGRGLPTYFIAEIGNNHNGDYFIAKRSIEEAARAGAKAVKLQKRSIKDTFAKELRDKPQTKEEIRGATYGEYREGLELTAEEFKKLKEVAKVNNVTFFATPFDIPSVDFLEEVGVPFYKIASFDLTNLPLLDYVARLKKPIILSTGMATLDEVDEAVATVLRYHTNLVLLHCVSVYPSPDEHVNLGAMRVLAERYSPLPVGYSGHEPGTLASLAAAVHGAAVIERHFTLSRALPGPDHGTVSIEPEVFKELVENAARVRTIMGVDEKELMELEKTARDKHSKSIVSAVMIPKGTTITPDMLVCKSPGYGLKPRELPLVVGSRALIEIPADVVIKREDFESAQAGVVSPIQNPKNAKKR